MLLLNRVLCFFMANKEWNGIIGDYRSHYIDLQIPCIRWHNESHHVYGNMFSRIRIPVYKGCVMTILRLIPYQLCMRKPGTSV